MDTLDNLTPEPNNDRRDGGLNARVAISVALLATFMGITKVKDDNIVQAMLQAKSDAVDTWAEFQAKSTKQHLAEVTLDEMTLQRTWVAHTGADPRQIDAKIRFYRDEGRRYDREKAELQAKAKGLEHQYDALNFKDDQFDLSDATLSVAMALLAMTALTRKRWLFFFAVGIAGIGILMGLAGLLGWHLHPTALVRLLS
jgi:hypothetical protein